VKQEGAETWFPDTEAERLEVKAVVIRELLPSYPAYTHGSWNPEAAVPVSGGGDGWAGDAHDDGSGGEGEVWAGR